MMMATRRVQPPEPSHTVELDERWLATWVAFGFDAFGHLLGRHAAFLNYCHDHDWPETEEGEP